MKQTTPSNSARRDEPVRNVLTSGLRVRTNLRAGLAWDDLDDQAKALWNSLTGAISSAVDTVKATVTPTQS